MDMLHSDSSDWESFSESGCSADQEELDFLFGGQARSILSSLEESIGKIDDFLSFERGFLYGDIVCSATDPSGQMGKVVNVNMLVDVESVHGKIIKGVNSKNLLKIRSISVGDYVVYGPWLGRVDKVIDTVTILFDDGTRAEVSAFDQGKVVPIGPNLIEDSMYPFYPGQRVCVRLSAASKSARWLCGTWKQNQDQGTICSVKPGLAYVNWFASLPVDPDMKSPAPPLLQDAEKLTLLSCFSHANWQLGEWCMLTIPDHKGVMDQLFPGISSHELFKEQKKKERGFMRKDLQEIFVIVRTKTLVDVMWQDGSHSLELESQSLLPVNIVNGHEFWPGQFVVEKGTCIDPPVSGNQRWGIVKSADAKEQTVNVRWKPFDANKMNGVGQELMEETVSSYELIEHPDYSYCFGDIVTALIPSYIDQANGGIVTRETGIGEDLALKGKDGGLDQISYDAKSYLSFIGNVTGFKDDGVEVQWATGLKSMVPPNDLFRIDLNETATATHMLHEPNVEEMIDQTGKGLLKSDGIYEEQYPRESGSSFLPRSAIGLFTSVTASIFGSLGSTTLSGLLSLGHFAKNGDQSKLPQERELVDTCGLSADKQALTLQEVQLSKTSSSQETIDLQENKELQSSSVRKNSEKFRRFDMVDGCSDHHYLDGPCEGLVLPQMKRVWLKKVQHEWNILQKDLPETIYVRVYEERMDLLRASIIGAPGTPYHDGLFFFDIHLPPDYPQEPPLVHYHSGGLRVNPNLYESGKVCLSLLNTWTGTGTEVWNPESSSILQVLLSLQALVLNEKPYFNEAGYDKHMGRAEGEKNSVSYNENAFLMTCKSMIYILHRPPKHFEALVEEHFRQRSQDILLACKAYMEGAPVACPLGSPQKEHANANPSGNSTGFKLMLGKLFPKLVEAFSDNKGIDCGEFM
ncbi:probable ubiquitin-conjugating enzyme E2 24 [Tripterygium wilfordii]|uniref:probable ubiquitin-conjugating enzyme E2 24 n=1 Tax=Tripterygium wilfordii TaxID=458696 RepID=UPI0018F81A23|nr:probable ubiquitin-conjugating enzyme E2 24 [Tripterygium wilfordii]